MIQIALCSSYLAFDVFLDEMVLALVVKDYVDLLCAVSTNVRPCRYKSCHVIYCI